MKMRNDIFIDMKNNVRYDPCSALGRRAMGRPPGSKNLYRPGAEPGTMYSDWRVIREVLSGTRDRRVLCECTLCGKQAENYLHNLRRGRNCDCATRSYRNYRHGFAAAGAQHPMYKAWNQMLQRCYNESNPGYKYYGARGIKVCDEWLKFDNFLHDMSAIYEELLIEYGLGRLSLERIDNDGDYRPGNCTWTPRNMQSKNRRPSSEWEYK